MQKAVFGLIIFFAMSSVVIANESPYVSNEATNQLGSTLVRLKQGVAELEETNAVMRQRISVMPDELNVLREKLTLLQTQAQGYIDESRKIEEKEKARAGNIAKHEKALTSLQEKLKKITEEKVNAQQELQKIEAKNADLKNQFKTAEHNVMSIKRDLLKDPEYDVQQQVLKARLELGDQLLAKQKQLDAIISDVEAVKEVKDEPTVRYEVLLEERGKLKETLASLQAKVDKMSSEENDVMLAEIAQYSKKTASVNAEIVELMKKKQDLLNQAAALEGNERAAISGKNRHKDIHDTDKLLNGIELLKKEQHLLKSEIENLRTQMIDLDKEKARLERLVAAYRKMGY